MQLGKRTVYTSLFPQEVSEVPEAPERKGRSEDLLLKRNLLLVSRYYYYVRLRGFQYHNALKQLEKELFLTERTITNILMGERAFLNELKKHTSDVFVFRKKYPFMVW